LKNHTETVQLLVKQGIDTDAKAPRHDAALIAAVRARYVDSELVQILCDGGARVDHHYDPDEKNALRIAVEDEEEDFCKTLLAHGTNINARSGLPKLSAFEAACYHSRPEIVELLINSGAKSPPQGISFSGVSIQDWAGMVGDSVEVLRVLRKYGIKFDMEGNGTHVSAIYEVLRRGNIVLLAELLSLGAKIDAHAGEHGNILQTVLAMDRRMSLRKLARSSFAKCVVTLLDHGVNVNMPGKIHKSTLSARA
jgi:ankyrin repeat protein